MMLVVVRHAESTENATKYAGFYQDPRPWSGSAAHALSRDVVGLTARGFKQALWLADALPGLAGTDARVYSSQYRRALDTAVKPTTGATKSTFGPLRVTAGSPWPAGFTSVSKPS